MRNVALRYGIDRAVQLEIEDDKLVRHCGPAEDVPLQSEYATEHAACEGEAPTRRGDPKIRDAVRAALTEPLEYPSLSDMLTSSDRAAIVPDAALPHQQEVLAAAVELLLESGVLPENVTVLLTEEDQSRADYDFRDLLTPPELAQAVRVETHDPSDTHSMTILTNDEEGDPVVLNRAIIDADVVLPIGSFRGRLSPDYFGLFNALYPRFSDRSSTKSFQNPNLLTGTQDVANGLAKRVDKVAWLLGLMFSVQVVPGPRQSIDRVVAGQTDAVRKACDQRSEELWGANVPRQAELVVTGLEGGSECQTWCRLAESLEVASGLTASGGAIVACSELSETPLGEALSLFRDAASKEEILFRFEEAAKEYETFTGATAADALALLRILEVVQRTHVYLLSRLAASDVEELDMIAVDGPDDVRRLVERSGSTIIVQNGALSSVRVEEA